MTKEFISPDDNGRVPLVDATGKPIHREAVSKLCPRCNADPKHRRLSGGFGPVHDICGVCGYDFPERTL